MDEFYDYAGDYYYSAPEKEDSLFADYFKKVVDVGFGLGSIWAADAIGVKIPGMTGNDAQVLADGKRPPVPAGQRNNETNLAPDGMFNKSYALMGLDVPQWVVLGGAILVGIIAYKKM